jgi:Na+/melibiose symporter-like transporter
LVAVLWAIIEAPDKGWTSAPIIAAGALGVALLAVFALWEAYSKHPMLDVKFFKKPRFTAASLAITLVFFGLFGTTFLLTQYFQFVLAYTPLETGVRLLPFALTLMVTAPLSARFVKRVGTKVVVATGLSLVTAGLLLLLGVGVDTPYGNIVWRMMIMAVGMGCTMAPATESIMGSLPLAKAGVGSAVNDTTRMVGGSLGVAVIGSVLSSIYSSKVADVFVGPAARVPKSAQSAAEDSLGAALNVAERVGEQAPAVGSQLAATAKQAFVDGLHSGVLVGAAATILGVIIVIAFLPARARDEDVALQTAERVHEFDEIEGVRS